MTNGSKNSPEGDRVDLIAPSAAFNYADLTADDFAASKPYEYLASLADNVFYQEQAITKMAETAKRVGFTRFSTMWRAYKQQQSIRLATPVGNQTEFSESPYDVLDTGQWIATDHQIWTIKPNAPPEIACTHPIIPIERLINMDTGQYRVKLAFKLGPKWHELIVDRSVISSATKIVALADLGIAVTSESAKSLVRFLTEVEALNYDYIKQHQSITRLGWIGDKMDRFSPYEPGIIFDGEAEFSKIFNAVKPVGSFQKWLDTIGPLRRQHVSIRIGLAASFASVLMPIVNALPAFVHFWATSGVGKSMILKVSTSPWADPNIKGPYIKSLDATSYALEQYAGLVNHLPLILDELQLSREKNGGVDVYKLTQGSSGGRGKKDGGLRNETTWQNLIITSGETPITNASSATGEFARIVDVHIRDRVFDLDAGQSVSAVIDKNYGHAGPAFVRAVQQIGEETIRAKYADLCAELGNDVQSKQVMTGAAILLADEIAGSYVFNDEMGNLSVDDIKQYLLTNDQVDLTNRSVELISSWIVGNAARFESGTIGSWEQYGVMDDDNNTCWIIRKSLNQMLKENDMSDRAVMSALAERGKIEVFKNKSGVKRYDRTKTINGVSCRVVAFKIEKSDDEWLE